MKIGICFNPYKADKNCLSLIERFKKGLEDKKIEYFLLDEVSEKPDLIAIFGGDGTVLYKAQYASENGIPILAINVGTVGFLSSFEECDIDKAIEIISSNNLKLKEKTAISIQTSSGEKFFALNDAVLEREKVTSGISVVAKLDFSIDGNSVYKLSADGIIISTPTGSTAYSLSAGGVILSPVLNSFIATPICSHSLYTRPIVYRDDKTVSVTVLKNSCDMALCVDGKSVKRLKSGDKIFVSKYEKPLKIVDCGEDFFNRLVKKLGK